MKTLKLTIKKEWFDMILSGEKKEEYRAIKPHWDSRLYKIKRKNKVIVSKELKEFEAIEFKNGYGDKRPAAVFEYKGLEKGKPKPIWSGTEFSKHNSINGQCYIIHIGNKLSSRNC